LSRSVAGASLAIACLVMSAGFYRVTDTVVDPDLWGHVRFGQDILESGRIPRIDPYSYVTSGQLWINHEWLAEVLFAQCFQLGRATGLILFKAVICLVILGLMYRFLYRQGLDVVRAGLPVLFVAYMLLYSFYTVRPQLFTCLFFLVILLLIEAAESGRENWLFAAPLVFALWANCHGGFLAGMAVLLTWTFVHIAVQAWRRMRGRPATRGPRVRVLVLAVILSLLATLANPYGWSLIVFLLRTATVPRPEIPEWQPLPLTSLLGITYLVLLALAIVGLVQSRRERSLAILVIFSCVAIQPLLSIRHISLFAIAAVVIAGPHWADVWNRWFPSSDALLENRSSRGRWVTGVVLLGVVAFVALGVPRLACIRIDPVLSSKYPSRVVARLKASGVKGNLAIQFEWGEYAIWHLGPGVRVSMDGRRETVYSPAVYSRDDAFMNGAGDWAAFLEDTKTDLVLTRQGTALFNLLKLHPSWMLCDEDSLSGLFARRDSPLIKEIQAAPQPDLPADGVGLCFP
jgi:hypothetical protein